MLTVGMRVIYEQPDHRRETGVLLRLMGTMSCEIRTDRCASDPKGWPIPWRTLTLNVNRAFVRPEASNYPKAG